MHRARFAVVAHLLSVENNWRLRVRTWAPIDEFPMVASLMECWPAVGWFERGRSTCTASSSKATRTCAAS